MNDLLKLLQKAVRWCVFIGSRGTLIIGNGYFISMYCGGFLAEFWVIFAVFPKHMSYTIPQVMLQLPHIACFTVHFDGKMCTNCDALYCFYVNTICISSRCTRHLNRISVCTSLLLASRRHMPVALPMGRVKQSCMIL